MNLTVASKPHPRQRYGLKPFWKRRGRGSRRGVGGGGRGYGVGGGGRGYNAGRGGMDYGVGGGGGGCSGGYSVSGGGGGSSVTGSGRGYSVGGGGSETVEAGKLQKFAENISEFAVLMARVAVKQLEK